MAAGVGERLQPFTGRLPKPALPLMGVPMIQFALDALVRAGGVRDVVVNLHHLPEKLRATVDQCERGRLQIHYSDETRLLLGSAGGLKQALPMLGAGGKEPFFFLNADTVSGVDLPALADRHAELRAKHGVMMTLAITRMPDHPGEYRELMVDAEGERIIEAGVKVAGKPFFTGVGVLEVEALADVPPGEPSDFFEKILRPAIAAGKVGAFAFDGPWHDIGSPRHRHQAHLDFMSALDAKTLPPAWSALVRKHCVRIGFEQWARKEAGAGREGAKDLNWEAPVFCGGKSLPKGLGPALVWYGEGKPKLTTQAIVFGNDGVEIS
ncbi:MAG: NDP-sugar synthase [Bacteriovoracia bacterium]